MKRFSTFFSAIAVALFGISLAHGQVNILETSLDFGCVAVGTPGDDMFTVVSEVSEAYVISFHGDPGFSASTNIFLTEEVPLDVPVSYLAPAGYTGPASTVLSITKFGDPTGTILDQVVLDVTSSENNPEDYGSCILDFFDDSIADESLLSTGPNGNRRYRAMRNRLKAINFLIDREFYEQASYVTSTAILRCDGLPSPNDFVDGDNRESLKEQLETLQMMLDM